MNSTTQEQGSTNLVLLSANDFLTGEWPPHKPPPMPEERPFDESDHRENAEPRTVAEEEDD